MVPHAVEWHMDVRAWRIDVRARLAQERAQLLFELVGLDEGTLVGADLGEGVSPKSLLLRRAGADSSRAATIHAGNGAGRHRAMAGELAKGRRDARLGGARSRDRQAAGRLRSASEGAGRRRDVVLDGA